MALPDCGLSEDNGITKDEPLLVFDVTNTLKPPVGTYRARFLSVKPSEAEEYGADALFTRDITEGEQAGKTSSRFAGIKATLTNVTGSSIASMAGKQVHPGSAYSDEYFGRIHMIHLARCMAGQRPAWRRRARRVFNATSAAAVQRSPTNSADEQTNCDMSNPFA